MMPDLRPFRPWIAGLVFAVSACGRISADDGAIQFRDVTARTGITFRHTHGGSGQRYIVETVSAGLALFDYDADGWMFFFLQFFAVLGDCHALL